MVILFIVSGMSSRYHLEKHTIKEFLVSRTTKLLVPSTIGLFAFHWILGYFSMAVSNAFETIPPFLIALGVMVWAAAQILNTPVIVVYRFGIYGFSFLLGYFVFAHDTVTEKLSRYWHILGLAAVVLGCGYVYYYFGENYAVEPVVNSPFSITYGWIAILAVFAGMKRWGDRTCIFSAWMTRKSFGLYVFHYLSLEAVAYWMDRYMQVPA